MCTAHYSYIGYQWNREFAIKYCGWRSLQLMAAPEYLCELLEQRDVKCTLRTSRQITFIQPRTRTKTFGDRAFAAAGPRLWNALPAELRNITDSDKFNNSLKTHLFWEAYGGLLDASCTFLRKAALR